MKFMRKSFLTLVSNTYLGGYTAQVSFCLFRAVDF